jgi:hypothetical protein
MPGNTGSYRLADLPVGVGLTGLGLPGRHDSGVELGL